MKPSILYRKEIVHLPNEILTTPTNAVVVFDDDLEQIYEEMLNSMYYFGGIGLAANQIGYSIAMFTVDMSMIPDAGTIEPQVFINPTLSVPLTEREMLQEGCLSIPGEVVNVPRATEVHFTSQDLKGNRLDWCAKDLFAQVIQHEMDHLNGVTIFDHAKPNQQKRIKKKLFAK